MPLIWEQWNEQRNDYAKFNREYPSRNNMYTPAGLGARGGDIYMYASKRCKSHKLLPKYKNAENAAEFESRIGRQRWNKYKKNVHIYTMYPSIVYI